MRRPPTGDRVEFVQTPEARSRQRGMRALLLVAVASWAAAILLALAVMALRGHLATV